MARACAAAGFFSSLLLASFRSWFFRRWLPAPSGRSRFCWRGGFAIHGDGADDGVDADGGAFGDFDFLQNAGGGRGNFGVNLVGGDFEKRFVALDLVAGLLQPLGNGALDDGFAHLGHDDVSRHDFLPRSPRFGTEGRMQTNIIAGGGSWGGKARYAGRDGRRSPIGRRLVSLSAIPNQEQPVLVFVFLFLLLPARGATPKLVFQYSCTAGGSFSMCERKLVIFHMSCSLRVFSHEGMPV